MKKLYIFDFDGTLTNKDTLFDFLKFSFPKKYTWVYITCIFHFILAKLKVLDIDKVKENFIAKFLKGKSKQELELLAQKYFENNKDQLIRPKALAYLQEQMSEDKYIVTASLDIWVKPFADYLGCKLICTQAEFKNTIFTGKFASKNCNRAEKVIRINAEIKLSDYSEIYIFGDTAGDKQMLTLATHPHFRYFE